jgi:hypothetical protein
MANNNDFNRLTWLFPVSDTLYCTTNLAVFPLYYIYLKELTEPAWNHRWQWLLSAATMSIKEAESPAMYAIVVRISLTDSSLTYSIVSGNYAITVL